MDVSVPGDASSAAQGAKVLSALNSEGKLTSTGECWLVRALDPFHDKNLKPCGYPDTDSTGTVVQEINLSLEVRAPPSLTTGQNYDCHVFFLPDFAGNALASTTASGFLPSNYAALNPYLYQGPNAWASGPGLNVISVVAGADTVPSVYNATADPSMVFQNLNPSYPVDYLGTRGRLVGGGFEVINTTAPLYKQGLVTTYLLPQERQDTMALNAVPVVGGGYEYMALPALLGSLPPTNASLAYVLPSSKQWTADKGVYSVFRQNGINNPIRMYDYRQRLYLQENTASTTLGVGGLATAPSTIGGGTTIIPVDGGWDNFAFDSPFHTSGAYFSGLSNQTTLQVNLKLLIEVAPGPSSPLVTVASPSPVYDPLALEMYSRAINSMPVSVPQTFNPAGEWWSGILSTIGDIAMPALSAIGLAPVGMGVSAAAKMLSGVAAKADGSLVKFQEKQKERRREKGLTKAEKEIESISTRLSNASIRKSNQPRKRAKKAPKGKFLPNGNYV